MRYRHFMNIRLISNLVSGRFKVDIFSFIAGFLMAVTMQSHAQEVRDSLLSQPENQEEIKLPTIHDSLSYELQKKRIQSSSEFYKKVQSTAHRNFFSRLLYPLLFRKSPADISKEMVAGSDSLPYISQKGKIIRSIKIYKAPVFGSSVFDTTDVSDNWANRTLNSFHFNTREAVIRSYLLVHKGDELNPVILADNERIIRQSALFADARFIANSQPGNDSVDLILVIKDVFPFSFDLKVKNATSGSIRLYNRNILGFGHQLEQSFDINTHKSPYITMSSGGYKIRNIRRSFTDLDVVWKNTPELKRIGIQVAKPFVSPETRSGGGVNFQKVRSGETQGVSNPAIRLEYNIYDFWGGYATIINRFKSPSGVRSVFALTGRYYNINYQHSSPVVLESASPAVTLNRYIAGLTLIKSGYYRSNMVYSFGRTEDIPTGNFAQLITGYETSILASRYYTGIKLLSGEKINRDHFIYSWFESGGYWSESRFSDGIISLGLEYISGLYQFGSHRLRSFLSLSYKAGINRISVGELRVNSSEFLKTYRNFREKGHQRLGIRAETVVFTPYYLLGFRFAAYSFIEAAMIASPGKFALSGYVYPALGLGLRIRNENLVFSTFQLGLTLYGRPDIKGRYLMFEFTDIPQVGLEKFSIGAPEFTIYQ